MSRFIRFARTDAASGDLGIPQKYTFEPNLHTACKRIPKLKKESKELGGGSGGATTHFLHYAHESVADFFGYGDGMGAVHP